MAVTKRDLQREQKAHSETKALVESLKNQLERLKSVEPEVITKEVIKKVPVEVVKWKERKVYIDVPKVVTKEVPVEVLKTITEIVTKEVPVEVIKYVKVPDLSEVSREELIKALKDDS